MIALWLSVSAGTERLNKDLLRRLQLRVTTTKMVVDFRKNAAPPPPIILGGTLVNSVKSYKFLGITISQDLKWELNIMALLKKAQQRLFFLRQLRKYRLSRAMMTQFYTAIIESILTHSIIICSG